jgi:hypothetical protein
VSIDEAPALIMEVVGMLEAHAGDTARCRKEALLRPGARHVGEGDRQRHDRCKPRQPDPKTSSCERSHDQRTSGLAQLASDLGRPHGLSQATRRSRYGQGGKSQRRGDACAGSNKKTRHHQCANAGDAGEREAHSRSDNAPSSGSGTESPVVESAARSELDHNRGGRDQ